MMEVKLTILNDEGLHARPAAMLVKKASSFESDIKIKANGKEANAKSLMSVMTLGLKKDAELVFLIEGSDAESAATGLSELVNNKFDLH